MVCSQTPLPVTPGHSHGFYSVSLYPPKIITWAPWGNQGISFQLSCDNVSYCPHTVMESGQAICTLHFSWSHSLLRKQRLTVQWKLI